MNESKKCAKVKNAKLLSQLLIAVGIAFLNKIVPAGEIAVVSKSSKQITINFPPELIAVFAKHLKSKHFRDFVREAFAEKLSRDFGEKIDKKDVNRKLGERVDLRGKTPEERAAIAEHFHGKKKKKSKPEYE